MSGGVDSSIGSESANLLPTIKDDYDDGKLHTVRDWVKDMGG